MANRPFNRPPTHSEQQLVDTMVNFVGAALGDKTKGLVLSTLSEHLLQLGYVNEVANSKINLIKVLHFVDKDK